MAMMIKEKNLNKFVSGKPSFRSAIQVRSSVEAFRLIEDYYGDRIRIFEMQIPLSIKVGDANFYSQSIMEFHPKSKVAGAYQGLAKELINHGG
ncbi:hypothetical protein D3C73_1507450 [compost metagenome]